MTATKVAALLGSSPDAARAWARRRRIPAWKAAHSWQFDADAVQAAASRLRTVGVTPGGLVRFQARLPAVSIDRVVNVHACPSCRAEPGSPCVTATGNPLEAFRAHAARWKAARTEVSGAQF